jgi:peptide/nickel transport system substrate-binding protein
VVKVKRAHALCSFILLCLIAWWWPGSARPASPVPEAAAREEFARMPGEPGRLGGRLVVALRAEPKTLNPLIAADAPSREVIGAMQADLVHINRASQLTEPALAASWKVSRDGLQYTLRLRQGLHFSDGRPLDADDVLFSFRVYLDESVHSPQRDLLIVGGKPVAVRKTDSHTLLFTLAKPYGVGERLFDGLDILPRHLLEKAYQEGKLGQIWPLGASPAQIAGLGPFRLKEYLPGQRLVLERNPYYWKVDSAGTRLPYLDEIVFLFVPSADAQVLRFRAGETNVIARLTADNFNALSRDMPDASFVDAGPGLEYNFLFFNLNDLGEKTPAPLARHQRWFRDVRFRQAVSLAVDREGIIRLVYGGRGTPLWGPVTPGEGRWVNAAVPHPARSLDRARELLRAAGFQWKPGASGEPRLVDADGVPVEFSIASSSSSAERAKMAALIQDDLKNLGMRAQVAPLEFRSLLDRVFETKEYDACVLGLASFDADPNSDINVWLSSGAQHLWNPAQTNPATPWEAEIDRLMEQQLMARTFEERKRLYDRVQEILAEYQPMIFLASPHILAGAKRGLGNFRPAVLEPYVLWNAEQLFWRAPEGKAGP